MKKIVIALIFLSAFNYVHAQLKLPNLFGNHMVLQQDTTVQLWGWANPDEEVSIKADWQHEKMTVKADATGAWTAKINTLKADFKPHSLAFSTDTTILINDILFGEVWLCGGQSNMAFTIKRVPGSGSYTGEIHADKVLPEARHPNLRFITVKRKVADEPLDDIEADWKVCTPETAAGDISAVSYFFALQIMEKTGLPVGLIGSNWGGTPAESWTKRAVLEGDPDFKPILDRYQKTVSNWGRIGSAYQAAYKAYQKKDSIAKATHHKRPSRPAQPVGPTSNKSPYKLYNAMIHPLQPFTLRGVIWYQGESNVERAYQYQKLFPALMASWREDWKNPSLPFYFVQISPHRSQHPEIREAQRLAYLNTPFTGMVVTTDNGDSTDIHPRNKKLVGERLSLWALKNHYGYKQLVASGPMYQKQEIEGDRIRIYFTDVDKGLIAKDGGLNEFAIAGSDKQFYPAKAKIENNTLVVWSDKVPKPMAVRFAWERVPKPHLFNTAGLPASPFKTDNWKWETQEEK